MEQIAPSLSDAGVDSVSATVVLPRGKRAADVLPEKEANPAVAETILASQLPKLAEAEAAPAQETASPAETPPAAEIPAAEASAAEAPPVPQSPPESPPVRLLAPLSAPARRAAHDQDLFFPREPQTLEEVGATVADIEALILKQLLVCGLATGRKIADQIKLPFGITQEVLRGLKHQMMVNYKSEAPMGDFDHELTVEGEAKARWHVERCTYCGAAPVPLREYVAAVEKQSVRKTRPKLPELRAAFADLVLPPPVISTIGHAVHTGKSLFIYGPPGNGKTSIAERVIRAAEQYIWIPRTITVTGEIIRLFDPMSHEEAPTGSQGLIDLSPYDRRWVRIKRPSIVVGGELQLAHLEFANHDVSGIIEAPFQMKANGGTLVIDDFGRQRVSAVELLNRWIVPLEKGHDYLTLPSGRQIQVPFDTILIFSTNFEPKKLVDEAFLRRIPYKVEIADPSADDFRELIRRWCEKLGIEHRQEAVDHLLARHYAEAGRPMRYCHPRDLMLQVQTFVEFNELPKVLSNEAFDVAVKNYFAGL